MNVFFALRMFREMRYRSYIGHSSPLIWKYKNALPIAILLQSTKFITSFDYIYTKMDNKKKKRNRVDKYRSKYKKMRRRFHAYKPEEVTTTITQSESMRMQDGEEPDLSLSDVGKTEKLFVLGDVEYLKTIKLYP